MLLINSSSINMAINQLIKLFKIQTTHTYVRLDWYVMSWFRLKGWWFLSWNCHDSCDVTRREMSWLLCCSYSRLFYRSLLCWWIHPIILLLQHVDERPANAINQLLHLRRMQVIKKKKRLNLCDFHERKRICTAKVHDMQPNKALASSFSLFSHTPCVSCPPGSVCWQRGARWHKRGSSPHN